MLDKIILFSLRNRYFVLLVWSMAVVFGIRSAARMDVDVFPDLTAPTVVVMTDAHGMAPEEVERLVTFPIETAVNGASGVRRVRSSSSQGFSFVWVEFDWGTNIFRARQIVSEKLITVSPQMPLGAGQPILAPQSSVMGEILFIGMQADSTDMMTLRTLAEWSVKPLILATGGVSQVTIIGGEYKEYQVLADPQKMDFFGVTLDQLASVCREACRNSSGGVLREYGNEYLIRGIARTTDLAEIAQTFVTTVSGQPVVLGDVAEVRVGSAQKMGYASQNAKPAIIISVSKQPHANTLEVTRHIEENLAALKGSLPGDVTLDTSIFRQAGFIETAVSNVERALLEGAIFVMIVLFLFLGSLRTTFISLLAIPLSLLATILVMQWLGMTLNTMSLGGMAIAIGSLVDDAIIDVENVFKRLRQNRLKPKAEQQPPYTVVFEASREIRASILNATLIIIVAFLPLFFLSGMEGRMLYPLGIAFIVSLFMSLIVASTLTPLLAGMLLSNEKYLDRNRTDKWLARKLVYYYERSLLWVLSHAKGFLVVSFALFIGSLILFSSFGRSFLPEFNEGALTLSVVTMPGTSLEETHRLGSLAEEEMLAIREVTSTARRTGRGELDEHSQATHSAEIDVNFTLNARGQQQFLAEVRSRLSQLPGIAFTVGQPLGHRIDHMLSGTRANVAIKLFGTDLSKMFAIGNQIKSSIADIEGLVDVNVEPQMETPQLQIRANRPMLAHYGISMERFNQFVDLAFDGEKMGDIYEDQRSFDLVLKLDGRYTQTTEAIRSSLIDTGNGRKVPLEEVADLLSTSGPGSIGRENVQRKVVVSANVAGRDLRGAVAAIRQQIDQTVLLPEGYRIEYGGQFESEAKASQTLMLTSILAVFLICLLLFQEFREWKLAAVVLLNLPLALIGGVLAVAMSSGILSIPAIIGFITLFGIATRNGILLVSNYQRLQKEGLSLTETLIKGSSDRLNAILMTALTAALALIPLAFKGNLAGNEIQSPMAKVILGGLLTSTLLNIYIIPIVYRMLKSSTYHKEEKI